MSQRPSKPHCYDQFVVYVLLPQISNANLDVVRLFFRVLSLFMMIFLLCHWNGCIQYFIPMLEEFPSDCWIRRENLMVSPEYHRGFQINFKGLFTF